MSSGEVRKVSRQNIQLVQNLIECCLQLYMNQKEVVDTLSLQAKIEPSFTELVWQKLEEENQEFFKAYHVRLMLKNQILVFNGLLEKQAELMHKAGPSGVPSVPLSNGSSSALYRAPSCYLPEQAASSTRPDHMLCSGISSSSFTNGRPLGQARNHISSNPSIPTGSMDTSQSMLATQASNIGRTGEINGSTLKAESSYSSNSEFPFCGDSSFLEVHQPVQDVSAGSFSSSDFPVQQLSDTLLDIDASSFGFGQIPRNFSFSDLTDDFTHCADILENYGRSPFLKHEKNNFEDSPGREFHEDENRRLDTISEGVSNEDFGSD